MTTVDLAEWEERINDCPPHSFGVVVPPAALATLVACARALTLARPIVARARGRIGSHQEVEHALKAADAVLAGLIDTAKEPS